MRPQRAFVCYIALFASACATVPVTIPPPAQALDVERVRTLLVSRLDTLGTDVPRLDFLRERGHLPRFEPPDSLYLDSLRRTYSAGIDQAIRDIENGTFRLLTWIDGVPVTALPQGSDARCWHMPSVVTGLLWRDFRVRHEEAGEDGLDYYSRGAFAEGYNRAAKPVIETYWNVRDIYDETWDRSKAVMSGGHEAEFFEWTIECS